MNVLQNKRIVRQVGHLLKLYEDARSAKHQKKKFSKIFRPIFLPENFTIYSNLLLCCALEKSQFFM